MRLFLTVLIGLLLACRSEVQDPVALSLEYAGNTPVPEGSHLELGLAGYAKVFCSAIFVSGREPDEAFENSGYFLVPEDALPQISYEIDWDRKSVVLAYADSLWRSATYYGDQGCIIDTEGGPFFEPVRVRSELGDPDQQDWPMGDRLSDDGAMPLDQQKLDEAVDAAFEGDGLTAAFLVLYKGRIVAERYADGINKDTQLESWSMGKSLTGTLIGRLIQQKYLNLDDKAPIAAWQAPGDPRGEITIRDLMQMSAGLHFTAHRDPEVDTYTRYLDHFYIYTGAVDAFEYSIKRPLQFPVGSTGRYRNCDPLTLGMIVRQTAKSNGMNYHRYAQQHLFDKIGIRKQIMETDPYGNFLLTGYDYGTARNWGRLGQLYLQDGNWNGEQILPENWSTFVATKGDGWDKPVYGGMFWLNGERTYPIPEDSYYMAGGGGQRTFIIPEKDMVVVRLGHFRGSAAGDAALKNALGLLMKAFDDEI